MKYRKKTVVIEAEQFFNGDSKKNTICRCLDFIGGENCRLIETDEECYIEINTLEGTMTARDGDYIIKGVQGEFYPCKPDIFEQTYEEIDYMEDFPEDR